MKSFRLLIASLLLSGLSSCGYHLGGAKPACLENMNTFCVEVFENESLHANAGMLMTTAMANALQSDGTYRMAPRNEADFVVKGTVSRIQRESLITDSDDTYVSKELGARVYVDYQVVDRKTGKVLINGSESETASFFNQVGSTQTAMDAAISYATRRIADDITLTLVTK